GGGALEDARVLARGLDCGVELLPRAHPGRYEHGLPGRRRGAHEVEVRHLAGADLVAGEADPLQPLERLQRKGRADEVDPRAVARLAEGAPLLVRESRALEVLPAALVLEVGRRRCV